MSIKGFEVYYVFLLDFGLGALIITIFLATMGLYRNQIDAYLSAKGNSLKNCGCWISLLSQNWCSSCNYNSRCGRISITYLSLTSSTLSLYNYRAVIPSASSACFCIVVFYTLICLVSLLFKEPQNPFEFQFDVA